MTNEATSFWKFIGNYQIEIPIIQRDYAQGRLGKEYLRNNSLGNLKQALDYQLPESALKLDFVYGSEDEGKLSPLDGQQRLTTLWLLHWYVALRAGKLEEASVRLRNFTYETRKNCGFHNQPYLVLLFLEARPNHTINVENDWRHKD